MSTICATILNYRNAQKTIARIAALDMASPDLFHIFDKSELPEQDQKETRYFDCYFLFNDAAVGTADLNHALLEAIENDDNVLVADLYISALLMQPLCVDVAILRKKLSIIN